MDNEFSAPNGEDHCPMNHEILEIKRIAVENLNATQVLLALMNTKVDRLIDVVAGRGMIPVDSLKWIIVFLLIFVFSVVFGIGGLKEVFQTWRPAP